MVFPHATPETSVLIAQGKKAFIHRFLGPSVARDLQPQAATPQGGVSNPPWDLALQSLPNHQLLFLHHSRSIQRSQYITTIVKRRKKTYRWVDKFYQSSTLMRVYKAGLERGLWHRLVGSRAWEGMTELTVGNVFLEVGEIQHRTKQCWPQELKVPWCQYQAGNGPNQKGRGRAKETGHSLDRRLNRH